MTFRPSVEQLEDRTTPCTLPAPYNPGDPPPQWVCDECEACEDGCILVVLDDADVAAVEAINRVYLVEAAIETDTEYEVDTGWEAPEVNPFVAQYQNLTNEQLLAKAIDARNRANALLAEVTAMQGHSYTGILGLAQAAVDAARCPGLILELQEIRLELAAITQIHNSR